MGNLVYSKLYRKHDSSQKTYELKSNWERAEQIFQTKLPYLKLTKREKYITSL